MNNLNEIKKRKTFAIISHPDAGKTTLTEKLLLFGGAIQTAGAVKNNKIAKKATSDFMEIEKQRGISVATSVMGFEYDGKRINILDTPGHKDFSEDTYRTLTAVDSVILVVDHVKGVEEQTRKLMKVCRMRHTPVIIFINKLDREGKNAFELLDDLEKELNIHTCPLSWPVRAGSDFKGVYNIYDKKLQLLTAHKTRIPEEVINIEKLDDPLLLEYIGEDSALKLKDDTELVRGCYEPFDRQMYCEGYLAPVFFGSAINNFGIKELLDTFVKIAPAPQPRSTSTRVVDPGEKEFSGFIFKIHVNLDPKHRGRIAFCRVCSGKFYRNKFYYHTRMNKNMRFSNPIRFTANQKSLVETAWPGDVIRLYDTGNFKIGDTLTEGESYLYTGIPDFSPEIFKELTNKDPFKSKQFNKGIRQLTDEGVAQLFVKQPGNRKIIGTVGELQFEVIQFRLLHEYGASCSFMPLNYFKACWITASKKEAMVNFLYQKSNYIAFDKDNKPVFFAGSEWLLKTTMESYPEIKFHFISEFKMDKELVPVG